jgi:hypothetical protein
MNFYKIKNFFKTPSGQLVLIVAAVLIIGFFVRHSRRATVDTTPVAQANPPASTATYAEVKSDIPQMPAPVVIGGQRQAAPQPPPPAPVLASELYTAEEQGPNALSAPYGRLVRCELVNTVDSSRIQTPIIGLVLQDVLNPGGDGSVVVPAGTEIHGIAQVDRMRERIGSQTQWVFVWTDGSKREVPVTGFALDHSPNPNGSGWSLTDGSAGLRGYVVKTDNLAELKIIAATFMTGLGQGLAGGTTTSSFGTSTQTFDGTIKAGIAQGVSQASALYAQQMLEAVRQDGFFVRVPAGRSFYLYVTQTLDPEAPVTSATKGNSLSNSTVNPNPIRNR